MFCLEIKTKKRMTSIAEWNETRWLVLTSCSFLLPCIYGWRNRQYGLSLLLFITSAVSVNYWWNAVASWRRDLDLVVAKIALAVFTYNGVKYLQYLPLVITGYAGFILLLYFYHLSAVLHKLHNEYWVVYHGLFHLVMTYEQVIILFSIQHHKTKPKNILQ